MPTYRQSADNRSRGGSAPASVCGAADVAILKRDGNRARFDHPLSAQSFVLFSLMRIPVSHLSGLLCSLNPSGSAVASLQEAQARQVTISIIEYSELPIRDLSSQSPAFS